MVSSSIERPAAERFERRTAPRRPMPDARYPTLVSAFTSQDCRDGHKQDLEVEPKIPALDVVRIQRRPIVEITNVRPPRHLPDTCDPRRHCKSPPLPRLVLNELLRERW